MSGTDDDGNVGGGLGDWCAGAPCWTLRNAFIMSCSSLTLWLRWTMEAVTSGVRTGRGRTEPDSGWDEEGSSAPEVAGGALEVGEISDSVAPAAAAGGCSMIDKVSDTRLIGLGALPELLRRL
jgi:hypothetical protein